MQIPQDVALATWGNSELVQGELFDLTSFDMRVGTLSALIMNRLIEKMSTKLSTETHDVITPALIVRGSCGCGSTDASTSTGTGTGISTSTSTSTSTGTSTGTGTGTGTDATRTP